jgi:hypothetical protein
MRHLPCILVLIAAVAAAGCERHKPEVSRAGQQAPPPRAEKANHAEKAAEHAGSGDRPAQAAPPPAPRRPDGVSPRGYRAATGIVGPDGEPTGQPPAGVPTRGYVTLLQPGGKPLGALRPFAGGAVHGFVVARDLRHVRYDRATAPARRGSDARALALRVPGGGEHALVLAFEPAAPGSPGENARLGPEVLTVPMVFSGLLPANAGPGVAGLPPVAVFEEGQGEHRERVQIALRTNPAAPIAGQSLTFHPRRLSADGANEAGVAQLPYLVVLDDALHRGTLVSLEPGADARWTPKRPGTYLVLAPAPTGPPQALAFRVTVAEPAAPAAPTETTP